MLRGGSLIVIMLLLMIIMDLFIIYDGFRNDFRENKLIICLKLISIVLLGTIIMLYMG